MSRLTKLDNDITKVKGTYMPYDERPIITLSNATYIQCLLNKLGKLEDLEEEIGCPLEVIFKALKKGIYVEEGKFPYTAFEKYDVRGIELKGLSVISKICGYADCDFTCYYSDYKKTWWLKEDKSE